MAIEIANLEAEESDIHDVLAKIGARSSSQPSQPVLTRRQMKTYITFKGLVKRQWFGMKPTMVIGFLTDVKERTVSFMPIETLERFLETGDDSQLPKRPDLTFH